MVNLRTIKKKNPFHKINYRSNSALLTISKIFEKLTGKRLAHYIRNNLSLFLYGYWKGYSTQQALLALIKF